MTRLTWALVALNVFNIVDAVCTVNAISHGAVELNPVMAALLELGSVPFLVIKISMILVFTAWLYLSRYANERIVGIGAYISTFFYGCLFVYHMYVLYFISTL